MTTTQAETSPTAPEGASTALNNSTAKATPKAPRSSQKPARKPTAPAPKSNAVDTLNGILASLNDVNVENITSEEYDQVKELASNINRRLEDISLDAEVNLDRAKIFAFGHIFS